jgi:hypothetical protein
MSKMPERTTYNEERFILAHGFRGVSPSWQGGCCRVHIMAARKQKEGIQEEAKARWAPRDTFSLHTSFY